MWHSVESLPTFTSVERLQSKTLIIYILQKWVNRPLNLILSESSQFFCANRPVRIFARIVPVESSQGGTGFCAKRPVTFPNRSNTNRAVQSQKLTRDWKFWI